MNCNNIRKLIDWVVIIIFVLITVCTTTTDFLWWKVTYISPLPLFLALCVLFLNHISIKNCFLTKEKEFFLVCSGIVLCVICMAIIKSHVGAFFTVSNFLLILYLADKVCFDRKQISLIALSSLLILFYWFFINKDVYGTLASNPNRVSLYVFTHFCTFICCAAYLFNACFQIPKKLFHFVTLLLVLFTTRRILSLHCRGVFLALIVWAVTYYVLPKKRWTIPLVFGSSLLMPIIYVILWKSGAVNGLMVLGKRFASGRDIIWYEFFKVFIRYPITGIGSDFDRMLPDLYLKEVHHSLLNILFVHGIPVFLIVLYLMVKRIREIADFPSDTVKSICFASIYGILAAGSFENYYIVTPYNIMFLVIFVVLYASMQKKALA